MNRRALIASVGAVSVAGCTDLTTTKREVEAEHLDLDLDRREVIGLFSDDRELGRIGMGIGAWLNVPYEFSVSASAEEGIEWRRCTLEFVFPDDIRPPVLYLKGETTTPIASFDRRDATDEFTTLEIREPTDEFNLEFRAEPLGSLEDYPEEVSVELNLDGTLVDGGFREPVYHAEISIPSTLSKDLA